MNRARYTWARMPTWAKAADVIIIGLIIIAGASWGVLDGWLSIGGGAR
jgi:hypothetical protein